MYVKCRIHIFQKWEILVCVVEYEKKLITINKEVVLRFLPTPTVIRLGNQELSRGKRNTNLEF